MCWLKPDAFAQTSYTHAHIYQHIVSMHAFFQNAIYPFKGKWIPKVLCILSSTLRSYPLHNWFEIRAIFQMVDIWFGTKLSISSCTVAANKSHLLSKCVLYTVLQFLTPSPCLLRQFNESFSPSEPDPVRRFSTFASPRMEYDLDEGPHITTVQSASQFSQVDYAVFFRAKISSRPNINIPLKNTL